MFQRKDPTEIQKDLEDLNQGSSFQSDDKSEWTPTKDAQGNAQAIIRFLPAVGDSTTFVKLYSHGFKHNGKWYIENCPSTIKEDCPVCKANGELWETGIDANKDVARGRKRKLSYYANILVVKDESNPTAEGKVFKYRFGKKIMDKIQSMANPEFEGEDPVDVTCVFGGADFLLKVKKVSGFPNYDDSKFGTPKQIKGIDKEDKQKELAEQMVDLSAITASDQFEPYEKLEKKFNKVVGKSASAQSAASLANDDADSSEFDQQLDNYESSKPENKVDTSSDSSDDDLDDLLSDLD